MKTVVYDIESFPNYLLLCFYEPEVKNFHDFEYFEGETPDISPLRKYLSEIDILIGFNNQQYDNHVLNEFLKSKSVKAAKKLSDEIIAKGSRKTAYIRGIKTDYDILGILDRKGSLKLYQARMGLERVLESPIAFDKAITREQAKAIKDYCHNDILATWELWQQKTVQEKLRAKAKVSEVYGQNLTSNSESEIASMVLSSEIRKTLGLDQFASLRKFSKPCFDFYGYEIINPAIDFETEALQKALEAAKSFHFTKESFEGKKRFYYKVRIAGVDVKIAQGGLHTVDKQAIILNLKEGESLVDYDVSSYYPNMVLQEKIAPEGLETAFLSTYSQILDSRLTAKKNGDKARANCEKIILNSAYGKFGDKSSWFYNPKNMLKVTLNCQFRLLQLVEKITLAKIEILQINTDGILCYCKSIDEQTRLKKIVGAWEKLVAFEMEETGYIQLIQKDANNYVAVKAPGERKEKGTFATYSHLFGGGHVPLIIAKAVSAYFLEAIEPEQIIMGANGHTLQDFCLYAKRDKWLCDGTAGLQEHVNRWVWAIGVENKLLSETKKTRKTDDRNVKLANDLGQVFWEDIDLDRYIAEARDTIEGLKSGKTAKKIRTERKKAKEKIVETSLFDDIPDSPSKPITTEKGSILSIPAKPIAEPAAMTIMPKTFTMQEAVALYQKAEFPIVAIRKGEKRPYWDNWQGIPARETWEKISREQNCNLGIRDDNLAVIDIDNPQAAKQLFPNLVLPDTAIVFRGSRTSEQIRNLEAKGHLYFKRPSWLEKTLKLQTDEDGTIIEIRTGQVQCVAPPSIHPDGTIYTWHNPQLLTNLPELPKDIYEQVLKVKDDLNPKPTRPKKKRSGKQSQALEDIKGQVTIYDILNLYNIAITRDGNTEYIFCLWHEDTGRPNCQVNDEPDLPALHCYACGANKDIFDTYMALTKCDFKTAVHELGILAKEKEQRRREIDHIEPISQDAYQEFYQKCNLPELEGGLEQIEEHSILLFQGGTGIGKTFTVLRNMAKLSKKNIPTVLFCSTVAESHRALEKLKRIMLEEGIEEGELSLIISGTQEEKEQEDKDGHLIAMAAKTMSKMLVTTYGYLGRKGDTASGYKIARKMLEGRIVFCDEVQELYQKLIVAYPLMARYLFKTAGQKAKGHYDRVVKCPKSSHKGGCAKCALASLSMEPEGPCLERHFYYHIAEAAFSNHIGRDDLGFASWDDLLNPQSYTQVNSTLFYNPLLFEADLGIIEDTDAKSYIEYLSHLSKSLLNPHIRIEYPLTLSEEAPISPDTILSMTGEEVEQLQFPSMACGIPTLCGLDLLGLLQFFGGKVKGTNKTGIAKVEEYKGAKAVVMTSATIPNKFREVIEDISEQKGWTVIRKKLSEIPFRFDVTTLKTSTHLSIDCLCKVILNLDKESEAKAFVSTQKKSDSDDLVTSLRKAIPDKVVYFYYRAFERERDSKAIKDRGEADKFFITYARSAISRGADFPEITLVIVDCQLFLPFAAIADIHPLMTKEERLTALLEDIVQNLTQILGRVLRSNLQRIPGQTVDDPRKIVVLLHGLPEGIENFQLAPELLHTHRDFRETFLHPDTQKLQTSLLDSLLTCLGGGEPKNYLEIAKQEILKKALAGGEDSLSYKQRAHLTKEDKEKSKEERKKANEERKKTTLLEKSRELQKEGKAWRDIINTLHLGRYPEIKEEIRKELGF